MSRPRPAYRDGDPLPASRSFPRRCAPIFARTAPLSHGEDLTEPLTSELASTRPGFAGLITQRSQVQILSPQLRSHRSGHIGEPDTLRA